MIETIEQRIAEIEARAAKATAGVPELSVPIEQAEYNAEFFAHSREDVPWLVAELKRARGQNDRAFIALNWADRSQFVFDEDRAKFNELFGAACVEDDAAKEAT
jgi:uncharacterized coiled-coil protein SlyX